MLKEYHNMFSLKETIASKLFEEVNYPWEVLPQIHDFIINIIPSLKEEYLQISDDVYVHQSAKVSKTAWIDGPCIIGKNTEIRHGAYIRGNVIIGDNCVIGNSTEVKNAIIFNHVQCPHYNYVGDAILGEYSHLGAGVILSNVKSDKSNVKVKIGNQKIDTNLRKLSAIIGHHVEVGCNSVLCPGTIIYPDTNVYPLTCVRGTIEEKMIVKKMDNIIKKEDK